MAQIRFENVTKRFGSVTAVDRMNMTFEDKEFIVLLGPSGCGKSTALRMIAGLEEVTEGQIYIDEALVTHVEPKDRNIAMVFQNYALYPHMDVYTNMAFALKLRNLSKEEIDQRVHEAAAILGLQDLLHRKPRQLSGGQSQRVAMGRAIVRKPKAFLFDEPLSNLDAKLRASMRGEIRDLHNRLQTTTIYVTHDQVEAMTLADRVVVMRDGTMQQVGTPLHIYAKPANTFVAGFIGNPPMNLMTCRIEKKSAGMYLENAAFSFPLKAIANGSGLLDGYAQSEVILGIRPEHMEDRAFVENCDLERILRAEVALVEPMGSNTHLRMKIGDSEIIACVDSRTAARVGETISLVCDLSRICLFDKAEGSLLGKTG
jgi:multiple sugar transport system ATP-binding protein